MDHSHTVLENSCTYIFSPQQFLALYQVKVIQNICCCHLTLAFFKSVVGLHLTWGVTKCLFRHILSLCCILNLMQMHYSFLHHLAREKKASKNLWVAPQILFPNPVSSIFLCVIIIIIIWNWSNYLHWSISDIKVFNWPLKMQIIQICLTNNYIVKQ